MGNKRAFIILGGFGLAGLILLITLFKIQILDDFYKDLAETNSIRKVVTYPSRGIIYDRNHKLLVNNEPVYDITVKPFMVKGMDTLKFCKLLGIDKDFLIGQMQKAKKYSRYKPSIFMRQLSPQTYARCQEYLYQFPGFDSQVRTVRSYPYKSSPHLLGYLSEVSIKDLKENPYYAAGDYLGFSGIEKSYELSLRGRKGEEMKVVDALNRDKGSFQNGKFDKPAQIGKDLKLTIDIDLQQFGEKLMQQKRGSIVAIEPSTGEILALISSPFYDPNEIIGRERGNNFNELLNDPNRPLLNRSIMALYPPGSTIKPLVALIGLQEEIIYPNFYQFCNGTYVLNDRVLKCSHNHVSAKNIGEALKESCNPYFWQLFRNTISHQKYGSSEKALLKWTEYIEMFGLGKKLNIDLPIESTGIIPKAKMYNDLYGKKRWGATTIISLGIGQGEFSITPLQLANYTAIVSNQGYYHNPHIVKTDYMPDEARIKYEATNLVPIKKEHFTTIINGMDLAVREGSGRASTIGGTLVCGKTGTAQNPHGDAHSIFIAFAPKDNPKIALAVIVENGGNGSQFAAPIAGLMIEKYLNDTIAAFRTPIAENISKINLIEQP